ncbi:hypothetical protein [Pontibacillus marinus]|uniref:Uncharacterized protein n=1 Tax=Pontibacillus marinus BH030004 = DSM 16465 TaxID=1385511 RepID=A0A0A5FXJ7_9BACI|nr:hypothetical protein [Pontibacillus marinus]KGX84524.1 hypothetical protein N783_17300 [Pontibacillus marinus BH030004 = DSM 16465]
MSTDEHYTPMVWKVVSLIILIVGILIGLILFISDQRLIAFLFMFIGIVGFLPLLAISQLFEWLLKYRSGAVPEQAASHKSSVEKNTEQKWTLSQAERQLILDYYENQEQSIDDILVSPVPNYVAVIVDGNLDVVMLNGSDVVLLNKMDVEAIPELSRWIEEDILQSES